MNCRVSTRCFCPAEFHKDVKSLVCSFSCCDVFLLLFRFYRRGDRSFRKAEKQRLKAEKRLLKAEVKEIRKQLRMERRGIQWNSSQRDGSSSPVLLQPQATQHNSPEYRDNSRTLHKYSSKHLHRDQPHLELTSFVLGAPNALVPWWFPP